MVDLSPLWNALLALGIVAAMWLRDYLAEQRVRIRLEKVANKVETTAEVVKAVKNELHENTEITKEVAETVNGKTAVLENKIDTLKEEIVVLKKNGAQ